MVSIRKLLNLKDLASHREQFTNMKIIMSNYLPVRAEGRQINVKNPTPKDSRASNDE